jgi:hypothetical protein
MTISSPLQGSTDSGPRLTAQDVWRAVSRASFVDPERSRARIPVD